MIRASVVLIALALYLLVMGLFAILAAALFRAHHFVYEVGRLGVRIVLWLAGVRLKIEGQGKIDPKQNYIFMPNHQGNADAPAVFLALPHDIKAIAKKEFFKAPVLGYLCRIERFVPVDRGNHESAMESVEQAIRQLSAGDSFLIYPEGTRTRTGHLGPFRKGGFVAAIRTGVPIVPITVNGARDVMKRGEFKIQPGLVEVIFHDPIPTKSYTLEMRNELLERVRSAILSRWVPPKDLIEEAESISPQDSEPREESLSDMGDHKVSQS